MTHIAHYVNHREEVLASIPAPRVFAKELFIRILYGGTAEAWCKEHSVDPSDLPPIVQGFQEDMAKVRAADGGEPGQRQYALNTQIERQAIDSLENLLISRGAWIHAYEHDGLAFTLPGVDVQELIQACPSACGFVVTISRPPSLPE